METYLFYALALILVTFSILTVTARNPVRSAVYLVSALLAVAGFFFLMEAEFVGAVQVLVYVGGIMVLFLFVIMLVSIEALDRQPKVSRQWRTGLVLAVVLCLELSLLIFRGTVSLEEGLAESGIITTTETMNTEAVGTVLYSTYLLPFEIASVLLLVAIVGAVVLAKKEI
ncbi:MAG: NADH-quinone oxidoreductase subunit J [Acidobacteriota bacterium]|nr:NADH-quinone oxidoreductase subunit J [Acidobacteriota bacterium]